MFCFVPCFLLLACVVGVAAACNGLMNMNTQYTMGNAGGGYTFGISDGEGNLVAATSPTGERQAIILKAPLGQGGEPTGPSSGQIPIPVTKGEVVDGCIITAASGKKYLYAALTKPGFVAKLDLSFTDGIDTSLNATSSAVWGDGPIQSLSSVVCDGQYVYFGTSASSGTVSRTVVRLDTTSTNVHTRFKSMNPFFASSQDLVFGSTFGSKLIFVGVPVNGGSPTMYMWESSTFSGDLVAAYPTTGLTEFTTLSGFYADAASQKVVMATGMGTGRVALIDMSTSNVPYTNITLADGPITSFRADALAKVVYMTMGDCGSTGDSTSFVALRFSPMLEIMNTSTTEGTGYDCQASGLPSFAVLDSSSVEGHRTLHVLTEIDSENNGVIMPFVGYPNTACEGGCGGDDRGSCAGGLCGCKAQYTGGNCAEDAPCGGSTCSEHGTCGALDTCECDVGYTGASCGVLAHCPLACSNHGACNETTGACECEAGHVGLACENVAIGCESVGDCNLHGTCEKGFPVGTCICDAGYAGDDCLSADTTCQDNCTGNGVCSAGECSCFPGWSGVACSILMNSCENNCNGHGSCAAGICECYAGYTGVSCSLADSTYCTGGCSGHGSCVEQACVCSPGWTGMSCGTAEADLRVSETTIFAAGENRASSSFTLSTAANEVVFCVESTPGKAISLDVDTLQRIRSSTFTDAAETSLLQLSEGSSATKEALVPDAVGLLELGADIGDAPISVAVAEDGVNGYAVLGTKAADNSVMNGQLMRVSTANMRRTDQIELDDDSGSGVTAGVNAGNNIFYFASGNSPAMIYRVDAANTLTILSRTKPEDCPSAEISQLLFSDGSLFAITSTTIYFYTVDEFGEITPSSTRTSLAVPTVLGSVSAAMMYTGGNAGPVAVLSTDASPPYALKVNMQSLNMSGPAVAMSGAPTGASSVTSYGEYAYFGHKSNGASCWVSKFLVSSFVEIDTVEVVECADDLVSASISADGLNAYFGNSGAPAHIYKLRLFARDDCPDNCNGRGTCVSGTCSCEVGWTGDACGSPIPECPNNCSQAGTCSNGVCTCEIGYFLDDCSLIAKCGGPQGKCAQGTCKGAADADGFATWPCQCSSKAWKGDFCDEASVYCPNKCSDNGVCDGGLCVCDQGFKGDDCGVPIFPAEGMRGCARSADCGTHGVCDLDKTGTGTCVCAEGWEGPDCDVDSEFRAALETSKISPGVILVLVVGASFVGMIAGVSIWKSWMVASAGSAGGGALASAGGASGYGAGAAAGAGASHVGAPAGTSYTRLPRRLVK